MADQPIIIIGAGITGLIAARELLRKRKLVIILEARDRTGGRIHTMRDEWNNVLESGAEFVHGNLPLTMQLLKEYGIKYYPTAGKMVRIKHGRIKEQHEFIEGWDELLKQMKKLTSDMDFARFLSVYFDGEKYAELRHNAQRFAEGFDLAGMHEISTMALYKEWSAEEDEQYRVYGGYRQLIDALEQECIKNGCRILISHIVKTLEWKKKEVRISTREGEIFVSEKVLITVPPRILGEPGASEAGVHFIPDLPEKQKAAGQIGFGTVIKILLLFDQAFWKEKVKDPGFFFTDELIPTWWTQVPESNTLITGWIGGTAAAELSQKTDEMIMLAALQSLAATFQREFIELETALVRGHVFNWAKDPFALGAYSFPKLQTNEARKVLSMPIENTLFFAGEALYDGHAGGTVEAALVSGLEAARSMVNGEW
jgi:monoamine oxidase